ncbi:helix-turn-helix domain-containing protein [Streptomyces spectabilis]|uniref:helix-turn-helix domain-containing protein n=1 Tax=Streptomyces spectabilis TaxID=68270 RepID=UPI0033F9DD0B
MQQPTLGSLISDTELGLRCVWPQDRALHRADEVTGLTILSAAQMLEGEPQRHLTAGTLVIITGSLPRIRGRAASAWELLLEHMHTDGCSALVVTDVTGGQPPGALPALCANYKIPLLTTRTYPERWQGIGERIQSLRLEGAERRAAQLSALVHHLPLQLADPGAMQRIADGLAQTLNVQVLVSAPTRVLAASPATAAESLAPAIIYQSAAVAHHPDPSHTQLIPLNSSSRAETVLAVARRSPFDPADLRVLRTAAKLMGLIDQACCENRTAAAASSACRMAAVELLLNAEVSKARAVMDHMAPGLLTPQTARIFVIETSHAHRDSDLRRCETLTAGRALAVADPHAPGRIIVIEPIRPAEEGDGDAVPRELTRLVTELAPPASLGGSGIYSMSLLASALDEALSAQQVARCRRDAALPVVLSAQHADLIELLPPRDAQLWARALIRPLLHPAAQWEQFRDTLPTALAHSNTVAARLLFVHRNTITRRLARASELLGLDLASVSVSNRIAVSLALEIFTHRHWPEDDLAVDTAPTLKSLLAAPQIEAWATAMLRAARADPRPLIDTAVAWLDNGARIESAARALNISEVTVRAHLRALESHTERDLAAIPGIRDLQFALYCVTGAPVAIGPVRKLATAA